ncbi:MAG: hypothetical protein JJD92_04000 [Frankiaceae bacterium]|nr:hypothetical protein [Frankiaceae bacterium]
MRPLRLLATAVSRQLGRGTILIALVGNQLVAVASPGAGLASGQAPGRWRVSPAHRPIVSSLRSAMSRTSP